MITENLDRGAPFERAYLATKEAAEFLSVSPRTLEDWRVRGGGPPFKRMGRLVRYSRSELVQFVESGTCANTGQRRLAA